MCSDTISRNHTSGLPSWKSKLHLFIRFSLLVIAMVLSLLSLAHADTSSWILPSGQSGDWSVGSNWSNDVPTSTTNASIVNGGTATVISATTCNTFRLGSTAGSGTLEITSGSFSVMGLAYVGDSGMGAVTQSDGTFSVQPGYGLFLGNASGSVGAYNLIGGLISGQCLLVGNQGAADFMQSGGTNSARGWFTMAAWDTSSATYKLQEGLLSASCEDIGDCGTAHFTQSGGTNTVTDSYLLLGCNRLSNPFSVKGVLLRRLLGFHAEINFSGFPFFGDFNQDGTDQS